MNDDYLVAEREHMAQLVEAMQRRVFFLHATDSKLDWPLSGSRLAARKKDPELFESLAAINERFAKLQDTLGAAMRHAALLMSEPTESFLKSWPCSRRLASSSPSSPGSDAEWRAIFPRMTTRSTTAALPNISMLCMNCNPS